MPSAMDAIQRYTEGTLPNPETRKRVLRLVTESIRVANKENPKAWEVTFSTTGAKQIRLNVGQYVVFTIRPTCIDFSISQNQEMIDRAAEIAAAHDLPLPRPFEKYGGGAWIHLPAESVVELWSDFEPFHHRLLKALAASVSRTGYWWAHSPEAIEFLNEETGADLPQPDYPIGEEALRARGRVDDDEAGLSAVWRWFEEAFPDWSGFRAEQFIEEERSYKLKAAELAAELLSREELDRLLDQGDVDEILDRVEKVGKSTNLLYIAVPTAGDLSVLYEDGLDKPAFAGAFVDLLHGEGNGPERLGRYLDFIESADLPNKWTFPTYFLFLTAPDAELFVKPTATRWALDALGSQIELAEPSAETYEEIRALAHKLLNKLESEGAEDMIDVQSFIWRAHEAAMADRKRLVDGRRLDEFKELLAQFEREYAESAQGESHWEMYGRAREAGRANYERAIEAAERGEDITDLVLHGLIPARDSSARRERGGWEHVAPYPTSDIKALFEAAGFVDPADWPRVASTILEFVKRCKERPEELEEACAALTDDPLGKGFQAGALSPILNAVRPEEFLIINRKPRQLIEYFTGQKTGHSMALYPETNDIGRRLIEALRGLDELGEKYGVGAADVFDAFSHWLVAVKKHDFQEPRYWKIAPGRDGWNWEACRDGGFIAMGWSEFGDVGEFSRSEFNELQSRLTSEHDDWTKAGTNAVWRFAHQIREGDYIVANRGTSEILGIGVVSGPYYFVPEVRHGHRLPVEWFDTDTRGVDEGGWRKTLIKLDREKFEKVANAPITYTRQEPDRGSTVADDPVDAHDECPFSNRTFELLDGLHHSPTKAFYSEHKDDFQRFVIDPFQALMNAVADELPPPIRDVMETESRIFARIPKNDWGRGGAWDFYWGAFYPKEGKRIEDAQLYLWMNRSVLTSGFGLGEYGSEQTQRFLANREAHKEALRSTLDDILGNAELRFGDDTEGARADPEVPSRVDFEQWLAHPSDHRVALPLSRKRVLSSSFDELRDTIVATFSSLFPVVLLANSDRPMAAIAEYLEGDGGDGTDVNDEFSVEECAAAMHFELPVVQRWVRALERKRQAVFYGPPGTGKTYVARHIAKHLVGGTDGLRDLVQFHPAYAYEDFMQGIRPRTEPGGALSYPLVPGRFLRFCEEAARRQGPCVLIIDEINRANLARVFGELMYLLEYRNEEIPLAGGKRFRIPENVHLIGTMNTADRSIALVDHALRRRFAFIPLFPQFEVLRRAHADSGFPVDALVSLLEGLNADIADTNYSVGISFFLNVDLERDLEDIWRMEIEPYLEEYFFDQDDRVRRYRWERIQERFSS